MNRHCVNRTKECLSPLAFMNRMDYNQLQTAADNQNIIFILTCVLTSKKKQLLEKFISCNENRDVNLMFAGALRLFRLFFAMHEFIAKCFSIKGDDIDCQIEKVNLVETIFGVFKEYSNDRKVFKEQFNLTAVKPDCDLIAKVATRVLHDSTKVIHDHLESANGKEEEKNIFKNLEGYKNVFRIVDTQLQPDGIFGNLAQQKIHTHHTVLDKVQYFYTSV